MCVNLMLVSLSPSSIQSVDSNSIRPDFFVTDATDKTPSKKDSHSHFGAGAVDETVEG